MKENKLKIVYTEDQWDKASSLAKKASPITALSHDPKMIPITPKTKKFLKWKAFKWIATKDYTGTVRRGFLKHPIRYGYRYLKSLMSGKSFTQKGDFFLYGVDDISKFEELVQDQNSLLILGFSYCHKPFECPSGRFTDQCQVNINSPVCQQCFIGKSFHLAPKNNIIPLVIPTVHYIGGKVFEIVHDNPGKRVIFLITACQMTLEMFSDLGNMAGIKGVGVKLHGRICNTMRAFELSEKGVKPGLTVVQTPTEKKILQLLKLRSG